MNWQCSIKNTFTVINVTCCRPVGTFMYTLHTVQRTTHVHTTYYLLNLHVHTTYCTMYNTYTHYILCITLTWTHCILYKTQPMYTIHAVYCTYMYIVHTAYQTRYSPCTNYILSIPPTCSHCILYKVQHMYPLHNVYSTYMFTLHAVQGTTHVNTTYCTRHNSCTYYILYKAQQTLKTVEMFMWVSLTFLCLAIRRPVFSCSFLKQEMPI